MNCHVNSHTCSKVSQHTLLSSEVFVQNKPPFTVHKNQVNRGHCERVVMAFIPRSDDPASDLGNLLLTLPTISKALHSFSQHYPMSLRYLPVIFFDHWVACQHANYNL